MLELTKGVKFKTPFVILSALVVSGLVLSAELVEASKESNQSKEFVWQLRDKKINHFTEN